MYYRKYFAGTIESSTVYKAVSNIANGGNINNYYNQAGVVCSAVKSTLEDVGIPCAYDQTKATLNIDGTTVQIVFNSTTGMTYNVKGISIGAVVSYVPFNGVNYKFYVTLKGDKDGILQIFVGYYASPAAEMYGFAIGKGTDLRDGSDIRVAIGGSVAAPGAGYIMKEDSILPEYNKYTVVFGQKLTAVAELSNTGKEITLVECVAQPGRFKLNNCYFGSAYLTVGEFYNIGGEIYYYISQNILVKCK